MENNKTEFILKGIETWSDWLGNREITTLVKAFKEDNLLEIFPMGSKIFWEEQGLKLSHIESYIETLDQYKPLLNKALISGIYVDSEINGTFQVTLKPNAEKNWPKCEGNFKHRKYETIDLLCTIDSVNDEKLNNKIVEYITKSLMKAYNPKFLKPSLN